MNREIKNMFNREREYEAVFIKLKNNMFFTKITGLGS